MTKDEKKSHLILEDKNIYKGILILAFPMMLNNFIKTIHDVVDMFFVSRIPGYSTDAVSAISLTFPIVFTFISIGIGLSDAGTSLISQHIGSGNLDRAKKYAANLIILSLILGVVLNVASYFTAKPIMILMGTEGFVLENSIRYLKIRAFELPFTFLFFAFTAIRQASGDTTTPVIYGVVTVILNIILSPILISVLNMGVVGAAYGTLLANILIIPFGLMQLFKSKTGITIGFKYLNLEKDVSKKIIKTGVPASLGQSFTSIGFVIMNGIIVSYGMQTVAAFSVGNRISSLILHPAMAIGGILSAYLGQNIGNGNIARAREAFKKSLILSIAIMGVGALIVMPFREFTLSFFIKEDVVAMALAKEYLFYLLLGLPLMGIFQTFVGTFNGTGNTKYTFLFTVTRLWLLRIPTVYSFKLYSSVGSSGIWYAMLISNILIVPVGMYLYSRVDYKPKVEIILEGSL